MDRMLTEVEVSKILKVSVWALRRWRRERRGPAFVKFSRRALRYPARGVSAFIEASGEMTACAPRDMGFVRPPA